MSIKDYKKNIIFDMDGTLIDSSNVIYNTINHVRTNIGLNRMDKKELLYNLNNPHINAAQFFYNSDSFTDEQTKLFEDYYNKHCISDIRLYSGINDLLKELSSSNNFTISIATNASTQFANKMTNFLDINRYIDNIMGADLVKNPKPHPDMILKLINDNRFDINKTTLIGDSEKDKIASLKSNIDFIFVNWGFSDDVEHHKTAKTVEELKSLIIY